MLITIIALISTSLPTASAQTKKSLSNADILEMTNGNSRGCMLRETTQVPLKFAADVNSKTAHVGDPDEFVLDEDIEVGEVVVVTKGGMLSRPSPRRRKRGCWEDQVI